MKRGWLRLVLLIGMLAWVLLVSGTALAETKTITISAQKDIFLDYSTIRSYWKTYDSPANYVLYVTNGQRSAFGFDLSGLLDDLQISGVNLCFKNYYTTGAMTIKTYGSYDDDWTESSSTTFPNMDEWLSDTAVSNIGAAATWLTMKTSENFVDFIESQYADDQYVTMIIKTSSSSSCCFYSDEQSGAVPYLKIQYTQPAISLSTTSAQIETSLNGLQVNLELTDETFATSALTLDQFTLDAESIAGGVSIASVTYTDDTHASLTLAYTGAAQKHLAMTVTLDGAILAGNEAMTSKELAIHVYYDITQGGAYDLDDMGTDADIRIRTTEPVTLTQTSTGAKTGFSISNTVAGMRLELDGISMDNTASSTCGINITETGNTLTVTGTNTITASDVPAIWVPGGTELTIDGTGSLTASTNDYAAAIGAKSESTLGNIIINGGDITALGLGKLGAGIGGAYKSTGGSVTVNGGSVRAEGGRDGAGIGSGYSGTIRTITINGGTITAGYGGIVGIGSGSSGAVTGAIRITGGTVYAKYGTDSAYIDPQSAAIGSGIEMSGAMLIAITGGLIFAEGNAPQAVDIGYGEYSGSYTMDVRISGTAVVFLQNNMLSDRNDDVTLPFYDTETIAGRTAYGFTVPDSWTGTAYAYIAPDIPVTGISVSPPSAKLDLAANETINLTAEVIPTYTTGDTAVTWKSSDEAVAAVSAEGLVTAVGKGTATITATSAEGGYTDTCAVTVYNGVSGVTVSPTEAVLILGDADTTNDSTVLTATISPSNADKPGVTWSSSNSSVATVDAFGIVRAVKKGTATITATTDDGGYTASCAVTVSNVVRMQSNRENGRVCMGSSITLTPSLGGGTWTYDTSHLSRSGNTFTPLKAGTSVVVYSLHASGSGKPRNFIIALVNWLLPSAAAEDTETVSFTVTSEELRLSSSANGKAALNKTITLTPNFAGGTWTYDSLLLQRDGDTFYTMETGTTTVTYTYETQSVDYTLFIYQLFPQTGDRRAPVRVWIGLGLIAAGFAGAALWKRRHMV